MREFVTVVFGCVYFYAAISPPSSRVLGYEVKSLASHSWMVANGNNTLQLRVTVPGAIYSDLFEAGILPKSIYYRSNDVNYRWVAHDNWMYSTNFILEEKNSSKKYELVFHGLDGLATVSLNNRRIGNAENTFVRYRFDVTDALEKGKNRLTIEFESPIASGRRLAKSSSHPILPECPVGDVHGECHVNQLRRMQASFGWDWGPAIPSVGIWKPVELVAFDDGEQDLRIRDVLVKMKRSADEPWMVRIEVDCETVAREKTNLRAELNLVLTLENGSEVAVSNAAVSSSPSDKGIATFSYDIRVKQNRAKLWWPNGYGEQPLYNLTVTITTEHSASTRTVFVGFRETKLVQNYVHPRDNLKGRHFYFEVNGVAIWAKGSNYIPHSLILKEAANSVTIKRLLSAVKEANMNMIRIWGGGIYADDLFYEECDRLGIMIWQDMMFACSMYPVDDAFLANVRTEISQQIRRLQYHPSIVVWAGNNENEAALRQNWYGTKSNYGTYAKEYVKLYVDTIRKEVLACDDTRPFLTSSPSNGVQSEEQNFIASLPTDVLYGDVHHYNYTTNGWFSDNLLLTRFMSEYGFQSLPSWDSLLQMATPNDLRSLNTEFFVNRQHLPHGDVYLVFQMILQFSAPNLDDMATFIYLSQVNQAWIVKTQSEWYRRCKGYLLDGRGLTMGAMYWQLNDIWQAPSWSSIELDGKWKMLHYYAKKFFAPVIIAAHVKSNGQSSFALVSDLLHDLPGVGVGITVFRWNSWTPVDDVFVKNVTIKRQSSEEWRSTPIDQVLERNCDIRRCFVRLNLTNTKNGELIHENFLFPTALKNVDGIRPSNIKVEVKSCDGRICTIGVNVSAISLFVWLEARHIAGHFSDNGFIMTEPERTVQFHSEYSISAEELRQVISVNVLDDTKLNTFSTTLPINLQFMNRFFKSRKEWDHFYGTGQFI